MSFVLPLYSMISMCGDTELTRCHINMHTSEKCHTSNRDLTKM